MVQVNEITPAYPVYIISKGRADSRLTSRALERMGVPYHIVVEPQEYAEYAAVIDENKILTLPFSNLGQGSIPARNWVWGHATEQGSKRHWILDDNIITFRYVKGCGKNLYGRQRYAPDAIAADGRFFVEMERFVDRYINVALAGPHYEMFGSSLKHPYKLNTRIYSCILILNSLPFRWRGRYNEDTDLSLRVLKAGWATIIFHAFLAKKTTTMTMTGGNTDTLYRQDKDFDGRLEMAKSLKMQHPELVKITRKWGRWQHQVDYRPFAKTKLLRQSGMP